MTRRSLIKAIAAIPVLGKLIGQNPTAAKMNTLQGPDCSLYGHRSSPNAPMDLNKVRGTFYAPIKDCLIP